MDAIATDGVTKTYRIGVGRARIREMLPPPIDRGVARMFPRWWTKETFDALHDVSIAVGSGESVGIVGPNGAGKTTFLKVVSGVTAPTRGSVSVDGRIGALIDVLVGFHPELTGAENAYLFGAIHGLNRKQMSARLHRILEFAEIDDLADTPVKRYSAGMQARLGFSTLVAVEPEILLIDEVLAVGDAPFQRKCADWLKHYREEGGTLVFVSHNLGLVRNLTDRVIWLDHGEIAGEGPTLPTLAGYARAMERRDTGPMDRRTRGARRVIADRGLYRWGAGGARVEEVHVSEPDRDGEPLEVVITYQSSSLDRAVFCVGFVDESGREIGAAASPALDLDATGGTVRCIISRAPFRSGIYFPIAAILSSDGQVQDRWRLERAIVMDRNGERALARDFGPVDIAATWSEERPSRDAAR
jgi:ABC-type polysaccharide/polyol phosphate transport system ATPase subunit